MKENYEKLEELKEARFRTICFMVFLVLVVLSSVFTIRNSIIKPEEQTRELFNYSLKNSIKYKVHLFENEFYEEEYLDMDRQYATDLVKTIEIDFASNFRSSKAAIIDYDYEILGDINGIYSSDSSRKKTELWNKHYVLLDKTEGNLKKKKNSAINEKIKVDFAFYNQIVMDFKKELRLNIDATFDILMRINYKVKVENEIIEQTQDLKFNFPLNKAAFEINVNNPGAINEIVYYSNDLIINYFFLFMGSLFLVIAIILFINFLKKVLKINKKTEFTIKLNKILKNFGDVIAESQNEPNYSKYDILDIANFEDLIDIENEVRIPIIYYAKIKDKEGWFTLVHGNQMYRYILRDDKV